MLLILEALGTSVFFFACGRRHTRSLRDWSSDVCSSDLCRERGRARARGGRAGEHSRGRGGARDRVTGDGGGGGVRGGEARAGGGGGGGDRRGGRGEIGRASCRERGRATGGSSSPTVKFM